MITWTLVVTLFAFGSGRAVAIDHIDEFASQTECANAGRVYIAAVAKQGFADRYMFVCVQKTTSKEPQA